MSDQAEKQKLKEAGPDARVEHQATRAGSDQAQAEMPEHLRQVQEKKSQFEQAALSSTPRSHVSETFGRLQMEDQGQVLVKGVEPGAKRAEHTRETRPETTAAAPVNQPENVTESTAHIQKLTANMPDDPELKVLADNYQIINRMEESPVKDNLKDAIVSAARKHSSELDQLYQKRESSGKSPGELLAEHNASYNPDNPDHAGDSLPAITSKQAVSYRIGESADGGMLIESGIARQDYQNEWQTFTRLSPDYQRKVIEIFQNGSQVGQEAIHETADDILQKTAQGYIDVVKVPLDIAVMAGKGLLAVLEFERDLLVNPERAQENAGVAGEHIGNALVEGIKLWSGLSGYASDVQQSGDYKRPFEDLGNALNNWYDNLSPGDQMGIMGNISAGFAIGAAAGQLKNLAKPGAFAQFLEEAASAVPKNPEAQAKAADTIRKLIEAFSPGKPAALADGHIMMMKGDKGLPHGVKPSERITLAGRLDSAGHRLQHIEVPEKIFEVAQKHGFSREFVEQKLQKVAESVHQAYLKLGDYDPKVHGTKRSYGTQLHELLRKNLNNIGDKDIHTESSYIKGNVSDWGKLGSSRLDVVLGDKGQPFVSICLKTLKAVPSAQQERGWVRNLPKTSDRSLPPRLYLKLPEE